MNKEDVRDRLNSAPSDWDKEGVWAMINVSEKKRRLPFLWWFCGFVAIGSLIGMFLIISLDLGGLSSEYVEVSETGKITQLEKQSNTTANTKLENPSSESLISETSVLITEKASIIRDDQSAAVINRLTGSTDMKSTVEKLGNVESGNKGSSESKSEYNATVMASNSKPAQLSKSIETNIIVELVDKTKPIKSFNSNQKEVNGREERLRQFINIAQLLSSRKGVAIQLDRSGMLNWPDELVRSRRSRWNQPKHIIQFGIGTSMGNHEFIQDDIYNRDMLEKNCLGFSSKVKCSRILQNWRLSAGLNLLIHQTNIKRSILKEDQYIKSDVDDNVYVTTSEVKYDYYNNYSFVDADLEAGYNWQLGKTYILPKGGVGFNLISWAHGDVIDENGNIFSLSEVYSVKKSQRLYYFGGLEVGIKLGDNYLIGLESTLQSKREVFSEEEIHLINAVSFNLLFSFIW